MLGAVSALAREVTGTVGTTPYCACALRGFCIVFAGPNILKALCFVDEGSVSTNGRRQRQKQASARVPTRHAGVACASVPSMGRI
jgi:hypothetical protein